MQAKAVIKKKSDIESNLGVLYTGYLEKQSPMTGSYKKRFLVLTQESIHWFNRSDSSDLLGNERGHLPLVNIISTRIIDQDSTVFEIKDINGNVKRFRCNNPTISEEWVSGIKSAIKRLSNMNNKRQSLSPTAGQSRWNSLRSMFDNYDDADLTQSTVEVYVLLVSIKSISSSGHPIEYVIARNPKWNHMILLSNVQKGDVLIISTSNGGMISMSADLLEDKSDNNKSGIEFEQSLQSVALASSLRMSITKLVSKQSSQSDHAYSGSKSGRNNEFIVFTETHINCMIIHRKDVKVDNIKYTFFSVFITDHDSSSIHRYGVVYPVSYRLHRHYHLYLTRYCLINVINVIISWLYDV